MGDVTDANEPKNVAMDIPQQIAEALVQYEECTLVSKYLQTVLQENAQED